MSIQGLAVMPFKLPLKLALTRRPSRVDLNRGVVVLCSHHNIPNMHVVTANNREGMA